MSTTNNSGGPTANKLTFSLLKTNQKKKKHGKPSTAQAAPPPPLDGFENPFDSSSLPFDPHLINPDLPRPPLVIPVVPDVRQSLQEQARHKRQGGRVPAVVKKEGDSRKDDDDDDDDQAAIDALTAQAHGGGSMAKGEISSNRVIEGAENTFQRGGGGEEANITTTTMNPGNSNKADISDAQQLQQDLEQLAPEVGVESHVYRQVPIAEFGAALLRGMGWTGQVAKGDAPEPTLPRPSRLGLGATPKLLDAPTHSGGRRPRRQDQVQREAQRQQQQAEYEAQRNQQVTLDKQRTLQVGSIVLVGEERAIVRKWQGVPGLNMALIQFEGNEETSKIKKGDAQLLDRQHLHDRPFVEPQAPQRRKEETQYTGVERREKSSKDSTPRNDNRGRDEDDDHRRLRNDEKEDRRRSRRAGSREKEDDNRRSDREDRDRRRRRERDDDRDTSGRKRRRDKDDAIDDRRREPERTWLTPSIRVRIVSSKMGPKYYKEKGVVVDVTTKGTATLNMADGQVLHVPERYLETALPKVGGNACILAGQHRLAKGRLLERDSRANRGAVQVFEDMNIVTSSLDDMAEWCGPLDDDMME